MAAAVVVAPPSLSAFHRSLVPSQSAHLKPSCSHRAPGRGGFSGAALVCRDSSATLRVKSSSEIEGDDVSSSNTASCSFEPFSGSNAGSHGRMRRRVFRCNCAPHNENRDTTSNEDSTSKDAVAQDSPSGGVAIAIKILQFYKREISPLLPGSCRFVPTCSEYGMQAFKKYGVVKGTILTAWRLSRCNPLGGSGFDPPRWFDEPRPPPY